MKPPKSSIADPIDGLDVRALTKPKLVDLGGDGVLDAVAAAASGYFRKLESTAKSDAKKSGALTATGVPADVTVEEDTASFVDLSAITLDYSGKKKDILTVVLTADAGTLAAAGDGSVTVTGSGTGTLLLTGTTADIDAFLNNASAVTYTGAQDVFGDSAATLTLTTDDGAGAVTLGTIQVDITDITDDQTGTSGRDVLTGDDGLNTILGLGGNDSLYGNGGSDTIDGGDGNDIIRGGSGADTLMGGTGVDGVQYSGSESGVTVDLNDDGSGFQSASGGDATGDVISGFENVYGSDFDDVLIGDAARNYLLGFGGDDFIDGGDGNDVIRGGAGADTLVGGAGVDIAQYAGSASGVTVDLNDDGSGFQHADGGDATGDIISGFENVYGSDQNDVLIGDAGKNVLFGYDGEDFIDGGDGNDVIRGGVGGDTLAGGLGVDWLRYAASASGVTVDLNVDGSGFQQASGGDAEGDTISGFENAYGSSFDDVLTGDGVANILFGGAGADTFIFNATLGIENMDRIIDYSAADNAMLLDDAVFFGMGPGALDAAQFIANDTGLAENADQRIIYETDTGRLRFDSDGDGAAASEVFVRLTAGLAIDETDFFFI